MSGKLDPSKAGDFANAQFLSGACELAYLAEPQGKEGFRTHFNLEARLISVSNTQAYVAHDDQSVVVAFRGSETPDTLDGFKDWLLTNANNFLVLPEGQMGTDFAAAGVGARFHKGFLGALAQIWDPLFAAVDALMNEKDRRLWVTGHSLGGALALLAAWRFQRNFLQAHEIYTFGAPMIGNDAASKAFEKEFPNKIHRYLDKDDFVPLLPTVSLVANSYCHCTQGVLLGGTAAVSAMDLIRQVVGGVGAELLNLSAMDKIWDLLQKQINPHLIWNYQTRLAEKIKGSA